MQLSDMQKKYIWLAGSFPNHLVEQGRGKRTPKLLYAIDDNGPDNILVIFGYSSPLKWLAHRGLFRSLQDPRYYTLTEAGQAAFERLLIPGLSSTLFHETRVKPPKDAVQK